MSTDEEGHYLKIGWITGERYCQKCGRGTEWPCPVILADRPVINERSER